MMRKTSCSGCPWPRSAVQPVSVSATGFRNVTRRSTSVVMTASPMLASVTSNHSRCWCNSSVRSLERVLRGDELAFGALARDQDALDILQRGVA